MKRSIPCTVNRDAGDAEWVAIDTMTLEEGRQNSFHGEWLIPGPGRYAVIPYGDEAQGRFRFSTESDVPVRIIIGPWTITDAAIARGEGR